MANYYYSGQGSLYVAKRNVSGVAQGFLPLGNVPELSIDIETDIFEHKESESGSRLVDLTIVKEKKGKFNFKLENLTLDNLAMGLWGEKATVAGATLTNEVLPLVQDAGGLRFALAHPKISGVIVTNVAGTVTYALTTDYLIDANNGVITVVEGGAIDTATSGGAVSLHVDYTYAAYTKMDAFMSSAAPERWLRFEGLNTIDDSHVVIDIFRAQFDPLTGYGLLTEDLGSVDMKGTILADTTRVSGSKFFTQRNFS